jgi:hypothetical protein
MKNTKSKINKSKPKDTVLEFLKKSNAPEEVIAEHIKSKNRSARTGPKKHLQGSFWKWINTTHIDLTRFGIFNTINKDVKTILNGDNCFIYACKMSGISEEKLRMMREIIRVESFPKYKIKEIAEKLSLRINIRDAKRNEDHCFGNINDEQINLLLMEDHYMVNEDLPISTFYIKDYHEIENNDTCRYWVREKKMRIIGRCYNGNKIYYNTTYSTAGISNPDKKWNIKHIIKTIFEIDGFKPISVGDRLSSGLLMTENEKKKCLFPISSLEYNPKYNTKLKEVKCNTT